MKRTGAGGLFLATLITAAALGATAPAKAASGKMTIESGGQKRTAFLVERVRLKQAPRPTIVVLHGQSGTGLRARRNLGLEDLKAPGVAVVYLDAIEGHWDVGDPGSQRDSQFVRDVVARLIAEGVTDRRRVFLVGASTGGMLAYRVACRDPALFAGVAVLIANMTAADGANCAPSAPVAVMTIAGVADPITPYGGGKASLSDFKGEILSVDASLAPFRQVAGCGKKNSLELPDRDPHDGSRVFIDKWAGCKRPIELVRIEGGGHALPGRTRLGLDRGQPVGAHNKDVDAAKLVLDFMKRVEADRSGR